MVYEMLRSGGCTGAKTGKSHSYNEGDEVQAPEGEFAHLPDSATRVVDYEDRSMQSSGPRYEVRSGSRGWHKVIDTETGEAVEGESERSEEEAQANADRLNAE